METKFLRLQVDAFQQEKIAAQLRLLPIVEIEHLTFSQFVELHYSLVHHG